MKIAGRACLGHREKKQFPSSILSGLNLIRVGTAPDMIVSLSTAVERAPDVRSPTPVGYKPDKE